MTEHTPLVEVDLMPFILFAAEDSSGWVTLIGWLVGGGAVAFVGSLVANVILLWRERRSARKEIRRDTIEEYETLLRKRETEYEALYNRHEKAVARHETEIHTLQRVVHALSERCNDCDVDMEWVFGTMRMMHGVATRTAAAIRDLGGQHEPIPDMPKKPKRRYPDADFLERTTVQSSMTGQAADKMGSDAGIKLPETPSNEEQKGEDPHS